VSTLPHEFAIIDWFRNCMATSSMPRLELGIGDDTAVVAFPDPVHALFAVDVLLEGVHFTVSDTTPEAIGRKALAVNLSDIAAMAGRPIAAVVGVALNRQHGFDFAKQLLRGMHQVAEEFGVVIAGGDTNIWDGPLVVSVSVLGEATHRGAVRRNGAKVGDWVLVTGGLGGSRAGKHLNFRPRVDEALTLHERVELHAMIDISDGLCADLAHILEESHVAAILNQTAIPLSEAAHAANDDRCALDHALGDGEDFELLFTVSPQDGNTLLQSPPFSLPITHIGEIVEGQDCQLRTDSGELSPLAPEGWQHQF